mmetsp:Transcript_163156/g.396503  ORF Transcript_163156/g.396503 Transcript_163156/m.396503 type:complete len:130 (-) Transcript_163156:23-412(-)
MRPSPVAELMLLAVLWPVCLDVAFDQAEGMLPASLPISHAQESIWLRPPITSEDGCPKQSAPAVAEGQAGVVRWGSAASPSGQTSSPTGDAQGSFGGLMTRAGGPDSDMAPNVQRAEAVACLSCTPGAP